ncbi:hypothetical protein BDV38DRAFT_240585 [Aspergillus pseudotamarii]|uniref:Uncharacterized protein n=1 Tax=Aspergillus pseudotamarii TaxID=132259 RepID=A0A5N6SZ64_ASPPS|nr:uncharacterized protein BDV38DRAFT_240585 [Aspergillus pseudotamarii]KAE8139922.1 hypothetical protein BDV38DRAFT_240585 [Aspergillus pseudotamarii]
MVVLELVVDFFQRFEVLDGSVEFVDLLLIVHVLICELLNHLLRTESSLQLLLKILNIVFRYKQLFLCGFILGLDAFIVLQILL